MNFASLDECFEICLQRIQSGAGVDEVLADYPAQAMELRPMLETAFEMQQLGVGATVPLAAQNRSRARFLTAAVALSAAPGRSGFQFNFLRFATASLIVIAILGAVSLGTSWASAQALPGDVLYPVKIMVEKIQFSSVQDSPARLELEEQLDNRRLNEVMQLKQVQRRQPVSFGGLLVLTEQGEWQVGGVTLSFPPAFPPPDILIGTYVQVNGYSNEDVVEVESLSPREYQWSGFIQALEPGTWTVSGTPIHLDQKTQVSGYLAQVGAAVTVTAIRLADDVFMAVRLNVTAVLAPTKSPTRLVAATQPNREATSEEGSEKQTNSATPGPRSAGAASPTPAATMTLQASLTRERESEKTRTPTLANPTQARTTKTSEESTARPSSTRPGPTSTKTGDSEDKSTH